MDRLFYPLGNLKEGQLEKGAGAGTGAFLSIDYAPLGAVYNPALTVSFRPGDDTEAPGLLVTSAHRHIGETLTLARIEDGNLFGAYFEGEEKTTLDQAGNFQTEGYVYTESYFQFLEQAADPPALTIDAAQLWLSDGTGLGDAGDFFFRIHQGGDPGSDSRIGFDISTFAVAGFVKNDVDGLLTGGNAAVVTRVAVLKVYREDQELATGDGAMYVTIPIELNGMDLVSVGAHVYTSSASGAITIMVHNKTDAVDMLSTAITIDQGEIDSSTAAVPAVIDTNHDDIATADEIRIDIDGAGTSATGLEMRLGFA